MRPERIDFYDPAEPIRFVGLLVDSEALIGCVPEIPEARGIDAVSLLKICLWSALAEVAVEIFFTGQIRSPRRVAHRTGVQRAQHALSGGIFARNEAKISCRRSAYFNGGHAGDPPSKERWPNHVPLPAATPRVQGTPVCFVTSMIDTP